MDAWIGEIAVMALERGDGVAERVWSADAYRDFPAELRALYSEMDGVTLPGEVRLLPFAELSGPPQGEQVWHFGRKGAHEHLFALRKADAREAVRESPRWLEALPHDTWVYGVKAGAVGPMRLHRSLSRLLEVLVPPRQTEDFGEHTFARAFALVENALGAIEESVTSGEATAATEPKPRRAGARARKPAKAKPAPASARKKTGSASAGKARKGAARKKAPLKSKRVTASAARKPAKAKPPARKKTSAGPAKKAPARARKPSARKRTSARAAKKTPTRGAPKPSTRKKPTTARTKKPVGTKRRGGTVARKPAKARGSLRRARR